MPVSLTLLVETTIQRNGTRGQIMLKVTFVEHNAIRHDVETADGTIAQGVVSYDWQQ
jgi:hypothetical protein